MVSYDLCNQCNKGVPPNVDNEEDLVNSNQKQSDLKYDVDNEI
jgi:hypothetical protein